MHSSDDESHWAALGRATIDAVVVAGDDGVVRVANDAAAGLFGLTRADLIGRDIGALLSPPLAVIRGKPALTRIDGALRTKNGGDVPVHIWRRDLTDDGDGDGGSFALIFRDASEWEVARSTLTVVAAGVEHAADAFEITDPNGCIEYANAAHANLTGFALFEVIGERITRFVDDDAHKADLDRALAAGACWHGEITCRRKDGALRYHDLIVTPVLDGRSALQRWVCVRRDITGRVEVEREAEELRTELALAERTSLVGRLAASVAHEVNNPATSILSNLDVAREEVDQLAREIEVERVTASPSSLAALEQWWNKIRMDERLASLRDALSDSLAGTERVVSLVRELRGFVRPESVRLTVVSLNEVVRAAVRIARVHVNGRAQLVVDLGDVPEVRADATRLGQVVMNIVASAAHSIPAGDPLQNRIAVRTFRRGTDVMLTVDDTGIGIAPEHLPLVFDPFFSLKRFDDGTGLGLAVSRDIVEQSGGDIHVESDGPGTRYVVRLPMAEKAAAVHD